MPYFTNISERYELFEPVVIEDYEALNPDSIFELSYGGDICEYDGFNTMIEIVAIIKPQDFARIN